MKNLDRWIAAYVAMDNESRVDHLTFAESSARAHPRPPALFLAASGGGIALGQQALKVSQNIAPLALVNGVVKIK
jgi:hypothetical protein